MNKDLAKKIATPAGYAYLEYLEKKYPEDTEKQFTQYCDTQEFLRFYDWLKKNK
jgi:hypothetical protein